MPPKTIPFGAAPKPQTIPFGASPVTPPVQPQAPQNQSAFGARFPTDPVTNFGTGMGSALGKLVTGVPETISRGIGLAANVVGVKGLGKQFNQNADKINQFGQDVFEKPFQGSLDTVAGQGGQIAGTIAPYVLSGGSAAASKAPFLSRLIHGAARAVPDALIGTAQTGGDVAQGGAVGVTSAVANTLLPGSGGFVSRTAKGMIPGYVGDVAQGLAGGRGEDRTGAQAFIPGAGTATMGVLSGVGTIKSPGYKAYKTGNIEGKRLKVLKTLERDHGKVNDVFEAGRRKGVDVKKYLSETDLLHGAVDTNGTISTDKALQNFDTFIKPYAGKVEEAIKAEGVTIPKDDLLKQFEDAVTHSRLTGGAKAALESDLMREYQGFVRGADKNGNIPLLDIHHSKSFKMSHQNYVDTGANAIQKDSARVLKEIVENNTKSIDVKTHNQALSKLYSIRDALEVLDGRKVEGGRLGKHFSSIIGGAVGSHFGPLGTILGAETARASKGIQMSNAMGGKTGKTLEVPAELQSSSKNAGNRNTSHNSTMTAESTGIPPIILNRKTGGKGALGQSNRTVAGRLGHKLNPSKEVKRGDKTISKNREVLRGLDI